MKERGRRLQLNFPTVLQKCLPTTIRGHGNFNAHFIRFIRMLDFGEATSTARTRPAPS